MVISRTVLREPEPRPVCLLHPELDVDRSGSARLQSLERNFRCRPAGVARGRNRLLTYLQSSALATLAHVVVLRLIFERLGDTAILRTFTTARIPQSAKVTYWNDLHADLISPLEFCPTDRQRFAAEFRIDVLGPVSINRSLTSSTSIERTARHVARSGDRLAFLVMPVRGTVCSLHYGREALLAPGDFSLYDSAAPSRLVIADVNEAISLAVPFRLLAHHIPDPDTVFGLKIPGTHGFGTAVSSVLSSTWRQVELGLPPQIGETLGRTMLDLLATCYAIEHGQDVAESSVISARRAQVKRHIEGRLRDSTLGAVTIGAALGLSPRYVRMVFAAEGESISAYILRRRLDESARQIADPHWDGHSITEIALNWGFASVAHFTRAFKEHFGTTPSLYRRARNAVVASERMHE